MRTKAQLDHAARTIADIVKNTHTDQRHELYAEVAAQLRGDSQHFSARLFEAISRADMKGG